MVCKKIEQLMNGHVSLLTVRPTLHLSLALQPLCASKMLRSGSPSVRLCLCLLIGATLAESHRHLTASEIQRRLEDPTQRRAFEAVGTDPTLRNSSSWTMRTCASTRALADVDARWHNVMGELGDQQARMQGQTLVALRAAPPQPSPPAIFKHMVLGNMASMSIVMAYTQAVKTSPRVI